MWDLKLQKTAKKHFARFGPKAVEWVVGRFEAHCWTFFDSMATLEVKNCEMATLSIFAREIIAFEANLDEKPTPGPFWDPPDAQRPILWPFHDRPPRTTPYYRIGAH